MLLSTTPLAIGMACFLLERIVPDLGSCHHTTEPECEGHSLSDLVFGRRPCSSCKKDRRAPIYAVITVWPLLRYTLANLPEPFLTGLSKGQVHLEMNAPLVGVRFL